MINETYHKKTITALNGEKAKKKNDNQSLSKEFCLLFFFFDTFPFPMISQGKNKNVGTFIFSFNYVWSNFKGHCITINLPKKLKFPIKQLIKDSFFINIFSFILW
ncbi:hypothetical protein LI951_10005 [Enterococcus sp. BWT-B8]|uniref:hypothetical protein n=1 Tax=Enterococcus sp. BWT-B8 TaxID=2885157 RepID=UPI001E3F92FF|nr:hypothetical protein [Enterococcus sp. BWT-B8]MCB5952398.1 hypothetical protein [Enterococcus sp. BWT-B8]